MKNIVIEKRTEILRYLDNGIIEVYDTYFSMHEQQKDLQVHRKT